MRRNLPNDMSTPSRPSPRIERRLLLAIVAAALLVLTPGASLAADDNGTVGDGSANENEVVDSDDGDELADWGDDVEVWAERPDGSRFVPEVLPELDY